MTIGATVKQETNFHTLPAGLAGQQTGSKRLKSAALNHAELNWEKRGKPHE
jgi:hypothetical protein